MSHHRPLHYAQDNVALMFKAAAARYSHRPATRVRVGDEGAVWDIATYRELDERVTQIACALLRQGITAGDRVGIYARNRPEWTQADLACQYIGAVPVPIYATNTSEQAAHIAGDCQMVAAFAGSAQETATMIEAATSVPSLRLIVSMDPCDDDPRHGTAWDGEFCWLADFAPAGEPADTALATEVDARLASATGDDLYSIIYTSGTTGEPKGVMLAHRAMIAEFRALDEMFDIGPAEHSLCFLPLSHALERAWTAYLWAHGCMNTYVTDTRSIAELMPLARPTMVVAVPKLYETIMTMAREQAAGSRLRKRLFDWSIGVGARVQAAYNNGEYPRLRDQVKLLVADRLVLSKIRGAIGGPKKMLVSGGAPLPREAALFFGAAGLQILNGYGMTEAAPLISFNSHSHWQRGSVGRVMSGGRLRIGPENEILYTGPNLMDGYWGDEEATDRAFWIDEDGTRWLRTGDAGRINHKGYLFITDRLKDIIVTKGGKNIAPSPSRRCFRPIPCSSRRSCWATTGRS
ncbi:long-chain fatty acid--CoA ligase [Propionibacterium acidifaciens]|uniref:AMP-dependent synthetase/ligase n=1 Tax=Propionibacterium acidifaciens TaxID=556499 RepID=UPI0003F8E78F|nr:AMP-binding protein [Propionibacterium acidifaciens]